MTIIIHLTDHAGHPAWMTAPFDGTGQFHRTQDTPAPRDGWQVIAPAWLDLTAIKGAIYRVSEDTALKNLEKLGCDMQTTPPEFKRRASDRRTQNA